MLREVSGIKNFKHQRWYHRFSLLFCLTVPKNFVAETLLVLFRQFMHIVKYGKEKSVGPIKKSGQFVVILKKKLKR